jgi:adenosylcobinamide-GDP ribazoletransferase
LLTDLVNALMLLTRLPVARLAGPPDHARFVWAFPVVGLIVGGAGGLVYWVCYLLGMSPLLAAAWTMAAMTAMTGALHEDGLADTMDGFGGGATPERKLRIMRDSPIGSYGALALVLSMIVRVAAIAALGEPSHVAAALIASGALARGGMLVIVLLLAPARSDGMGGVMGKPLIGSAALGLGLAMAAGLLCLPPRGALPAIVFECAAALGFSRLAYRQIGGFTGDVLGAAEVVGECAVLTAVTGAFV